VLAALAALGAHAARAQDLPEDLPVALGATPNRYQTDKALEAARADPSLSPKRTVRTLQWHGTTREQPRERREGGLSWVGGLFTWAAESARVLLWVAVGLLAAMAAVYMARLWRTRARGGGASQAFVAPSHVRDLDIRPESLPDDVGAAARALWQAGERRAALALLYRGLLSRLVHLHGVPIRASSTEGDCLALAAARLDAPRRAYTERLVKIWLRAVYGAELPQTDAVERLCTEFAGALAAPAAAPLEPDAGGRS
jgi:hypothetical protein